MRRRGVPKYSRRQGGRQKESSSSLGEIDRRNSEAFWDNYEGRVCRGCGFLLEGNRRLSGYCGECRESLNRELATERYLRKERMLQARLLEEKKAARRAK